MGLIPGPGRCLGEGHGHPLQYSCLNNPMGRGAWRATVHRITEPNMTKATEHMRACAHTHTHTHTHTNTTLEKEGKIAKEKDLDSRNQRDIKLVGTGCCAPKMCAHLSQKPQASLGLSIPSQIIPIRSDPQYICRIKEGSQDLTLPPRKQVFPLPLYFHKHATDPMVCEGGELEFTVSC